MSESRTADFVKDVATRVLSDIRIASREVYAEPVLEWLIFTGLSVFGFLVAWYYGLAEKLVDGDRTHISAIIWLLYGAFSIWCFREILVIARQRETADRIARRIEATGLIGIPASFSGLFADHIQALMQITTHSRSDRADQTTLLRVLASRLRHPVDTGNLLGDILVKLGLFGTIVGFVLMLSPIGGIDPENPASLRMALGTVSDGMAVAMYTTLSGLGAALLLRIQYQFLVKASTLLFESMVQFTEVHVMPTLSEMREH
jgi:biopolymer transport protein ExbB/TolQ